MDVVKRRNFLKYLGLGGGALAAGAYARGTGPGTASASEPSETEQGELPYPGHTGRPGELDALLYPPPALPGSPGRVREYTLTAETTMVEIANNTYWRGWTYNGTIPGPIIRCTEGDILRVTLKNKDTMPHTIHWHGVHAARQDGVFDMVNPGEQFVYEFPAEPFGLYPYHCHAEPLIPHITKGLYGAMIVDPPEPREPAHELVMVMNGFDTDDNGDNDIYTVNGKAGYYALNPIPIKRNELVRIYLVNMTEVDAVNSLHIHANMFQLYRSGTSLVPHELTDIVNLGVAERAIVEFRYKYDGFYMFHAHQAEFSDKGWMGFFEVTDDGKPSGRKPNTAAMHHPLGHR